MAVKIVGAVGAAGFAAMVLLVVVIAGSTSQAGTNAAADVVVLEDLAAQSCVGTVSAALVVPAAPPSAGAPGTAITDLSQVQAQNAAAVVAVADAAGTGNQGAVIAVMVAVTESSLSTAATSGDHIGLFQQSPSWGSAAQRLDPSASAALFIQRLTALAGWAQMLPWVAAQEVQASQFDGLLGSASAPYWRCLKDTKARRAGGALRGPHRNR